MKLTPPELKIITQKQYAIGLMNYCTHCEAKNVLQAYSPMFKAFVVYSLQTFLEKITKKVFSVMHQPANHKITFKLNHAERHSLSILFLLDPIDGQLAHLELQIINRLTINK